MVLPHFKYICGVLQAFRTSLSTRPPQAADWQGVSFHLPSDRHCLLLILPFLPWIGKGRGEKEVEWRTGHGVTSSTLPFPLHSLCHWVRRVAFSALHQVPGAGLALQAVMWTPTTSSPAHFLSLSWRPRQLLFSLHLFLVHLLLCK